MLTPFRSCLLAISLVIGFVQPSIAEDFNSLVESAREARKQGKFLKAAELLLKAYNIESNPILLNNIGKMYEEAGQYRKAYDAYQDVADDSGAPGEIRRMNLQRIQGLEAKLLKAHFVVKAPEDIQELWVGDIHVPKANFGFEQSFDGGKNGIEYMYGGEAELSLVWKTLPIGVRTTLDAERMTQLVSAKLSGLRLNGLKSVMVNSHMLNTPFETFDVLRLAPGQYLVELTFENGSIYERTFTLRADETVSTSNYATTFSRTQAPTDDVKGNNVWLKSSAVAVGVGLTTAGSLLAIDASNVHDDIRMNTEIGMRDAEEKWNAATTKGDTGILLLGVGMTALTSGLLWLFLEKKANESNSAWEWLPQPYLSPVYGFDNAPRSQTESNSADW